MNVVKTIVHPAFTIDLLQNPLGRLESLEKVPNMLLPLVNNKTGHLEMFYMRATFIEENLTRNYDGGIVGGIVAKEIIAYCEEIGFPIKREISGLESAGFQSMRGGPSRARNSTQETDPKQEEEFWINTLACAVLEQFNDLSQRTGMAMPYGIAYPTKGNSFMVTYENQKLKTIGVEFPDVRVSMYIESTIPEDMLKANREAYQAFAGGAQSFDNRPSRHGLLFAYPDLGKGIYVRGFVHSKGRIVNEAGIEALFSYEMLEKLIRAELVKVLQTITATV